MDVLRLQREYSPGEWPKPGNFAYLDVPATGVAKRCSRPS